jgi:hypothetical protein
VLVVHRTNFDGTGVVPGEKRHMSLHKSLKCLSSGAGKE